MIILFCRFMNWVEDNPSFALGFSLGGLGIACNHHDRVVIILYSFVFFAQLLIMYKR